MAATPSLLVVQHDDHLPPGLIAEWAFDAGVALEVVRADQEALRPASADAVVLLGSDTSAADWHQPRVRRELAWLARTVREVPVLGIAYGGHLLATVLGGRVRRTAPWIGYGSAFVAGAGGVPTGPWLTWGEDAVVAPPGSRLLARTGRASLAFGHGAHVGVQFHPEVTPWLVDWWSDPERGRALRPVAAPQLRALAREHAEAGGAASRSLFDGFLARALATPARS